MLVLGIDTSSMVGSVAAARDGEPLGRRTISVDMEHSAKLLPCMEGLLGELGLVPGDLDAVAVGVGPGSYTGVRVGIAFAKGLAYGIKAPVVGVCSFESMLYESRDFDGTICTLVDAKMGGTYWAAYTWEDGEIRTVQSPIVTPESEVDFKCCEKVLFVGPEIEKFIGVLREKFASKAIIEFKEVFPDAGFIAVRGGEKLVEKERHPEERLEPYYLRPSLAEISWRKKR